MEAPTRADRLQAESMVSDNAEWLIYNPWTTDVPLEDWLEENAPSRLTSEDGIGWIGVRSSQQILRLGSENQDATDVVGLQESWEQLKASGRTINYQSIKEIAMMHHVTSGKWLFHTSTGLKVDHLWSVIAKGVVQGHLGNFAKVSPFHPDDPDPKHVILAYNDDFTNEEQVMSLENGIRGLGIKAQLNYKPDVYTYTGIYRGNEWGLRPTIYSSNFDLLAGHSKISYH